MILVTWFHPADMSWYLCEVILVTCFHFAGISWYVCEWNKVTGTIISWGVVRHTLQEQSGPRSAVLISHPRKNVPIIDNSHIALSTHPITSNPCLTLQPASPSIRTASLPPPPTVSCFHVKISHVLLRQITFCKGLRRRQSLITCTKEVKRSDCCAKSRETANTERPQNWRRE
jgi:hypothetical protein